MHHNRVSNGLWPAGAPGKRRVSAAPTGPSGGAQLRRDLGAHVANQLARRMVVPAHRPGGQAQFIDLSVPTTDDDALAPVLDWARSRLDRPLESTDLPIEKIGELSGLGTANNLRHHFFRHIGVSPREYRRAWRQAAC